MTITLDHLTEYPRAGWTKAPKMNADTANSVSVTHHHGLTVASFPTRVVIVSGKPVHTNTIYWDPAYQCYFVRGVYGKKDGTRGKRPAHTVLLAEELPTDVHKAIRAEI